jgi:hypothetical protein
MKFTVVSASMAFMQIAGISVDYGHYGIAMANLICSIGAMSIAIMDP